MHRCELCGSPVWIERHHVFFGAGQRQRSEQYGMVADLCHYCHNEPPKGVHHNRKTDLMVKRRYQRIFEETHTREEFMQIFGRNYL